MKRLLFFIIVIFSPLFVKTTSLAQSEKKYIKEADAASRLGEKKAALDLYIKALEKNPDNAEVNYKIGLLLLESEVKTKALPYLEKSKSLGLPLEFHIDKYLGVAYQFNYKFEKAIEHFQAYKSQITDKEEIRKVERRIFECKNGIEFLANPISAKIENLGPTINTAFPEYAPVVSADDSILIFTSRRPNSTGGLKDNSGAYFEDLYQSRKINGAWSEPQNLGAPINTTSHEATVGISPDGLQLFIYKDIGNGDIYICRLNKEQRWSRPVSISSEINSVKYFENGASLSFDGQKLFFASNREGGVGGNDIWMSVKNEKGEWGKTFNLPFNSGSDEESPFMDLDGKTLYFSSRGHKGMGGFDIFKTMYDEATQKWSTPENLGYPINSPDNDLYFVLSGDGRFGYYASSKEDSYGDKDIYRISMPPRQDYEELVARVKRIKASAVTGNIAKVQDARIEIKGKILEFGNSKPLEGTIQLVDNNGKVAQELTSKADGNYSFTFLPDSSRTYTLTAYKKGYGITSQVISSKIDQSASIVINIDLILKKLEIGNRFILRNIYFDFDKSEIRPESINELDKLVQLLRENPTVKIEIAGFTDSKGEKDYNIKLSQKRAEEVLNYLVSKGISKERLKAKGYGENSNTEGERDNKEELSRRTEFVIIGK